MNQIEIFNQTQDLVKKLLETPHYRKMGEEGVFSIVQTAKSLGIDPFIALSGGLYYVKGRVEMSARTMNSLIRSRKHSITRDKKSDDTICILHGKRADNGDTWTESFSIQEAQKAGLANNPVWKNFTRDMLFARALSRLARQLFPDLIGNTYVEGEISLDPNIIEIKDRSSHVPQEVVEAKAEEEKDTPINTAQVARLNRILEGNEPLREKIESRLKNLGFEDYSQIPQSKYKEIVEFVESKIKEEK